MRIEQYWFGFVVVDKFGVALSQAYETRREAENFILWSRYDTLSPADQDSLLREICPF